MSTVSLNNLSGSYLQSVIQQAIQGGTAQTAGASPLSAVNDNGQLSPLAQSLSLLQQLQQSNPAEYQQVTQQIAANLQSAAQTAQTQGNTSAAKQLTQLAADFTNASSSGQLPSIQDLAKAMSGHHGHHHHSSASSSDSSANATQNQFQSLFESGSTSSNSLDPASIILNTLSTAGLTS